MLLLALQGVITITAQVLPALEMSSDLTTRQLKGVRQTKYVEAPPTAPLSDVLLASRGPISLPKVEITVSRAPMVFVVRID